MQMIQLDFPLSKQQNKLVHLIDILVDGRYVDSIRQEDLKNNPQGINFRGSTNQRIIKVPQSLAQNQIIERTDLYEDEKIVARDRDFKKIKR